MGRFTWVAAVLWVGGVMMFASPPRAVVAQPPARIKGLFLGDNGHHQPPLRYRQLAPVLANRGIDLVYSDRLDSLNRETLKAYDTLVVFANHGEIAPDQEQALIEFVEGGKGLVPLHCATYCFLNSPKYIALVGAQFQRHGTGVFRTELSSLDHPIMKGFRGFESWDETYVHHKHNEQGRTVLEYRTDENGREPWTWVRTQGRGACSTRRGDTTSGRGAIRAFRTWSNAGSGGRSAVIRRWRPHSPIVQK